MNVRGASQNAHLQFNRCCPGDLEKGGINPNKSREQEQNRFHRAILGLHSKEPSSNFQLFTSATRLNCDFMVQQFLLTNFLSAFVVPKII